MACYVRPSVQPEDRWKIQVLRQETAHTRVEQVASSLLESGTLQL